ncbi:MAG TPA: hypothetical protein VMV84_05840, partial [Dehalococcoidales bacterium]|nr:hypothetical protein [Dehalococcoidales bacterium]
GAEGDTLWNNVVFTSKNNRSSITGMTDDGKGNAIIIWTVLTPENGEEGCHRFDHATIAKVDAQGQTLWQKDIYEEGTRVINDSSGGAIIIWPTKEGFCAQRIGADGNPLWKKCLSGSGHGLKLASDDMGGALILRDNRDNPYFVAQKLDADGQILWAQEGMPEGIRIKYIEGSFEQQPQIVSDGSGGAIITWAEVASEGMPCYIWVLKIGADGGVLWYDPVRELTVRVHPLTRVVSAGSGGAVVVWEDHRQGMALYAQKVNPEGEAQWQENGLPVCVDLPRVSPRFDAVSNGLEGAIVVWGDGDQNLYAQKIDAVGMRQWGTDGILIAIGVCDLPSEISPDDRGGVLLGWTTGREVHHPEQSYIQRIGPYGKLLWGGERIRLNP